MKCTAPIPVLKSRAKALAKRDRIPLSEALDQVARTQGFSAWSLLAAQEAQSRQDQLLSCLAPGDLVLLGARPGKGKTLMGLQLIADAVAKGGSGVFFTLEYTQTDVVARLRQLGVDPQALGDAFGLDISDDICADYVIERVAGMPPGGLVVIDYMQLLDQRSDHPDLAHQVTALRNCAQRQGLIVVMISQIRRDYDPAVRPIPELSDVRLPNPLDLSLFSKTCFIGDGGVNITPVAA
ncbi:DNA helicase [Cognatiyoonia sp. IB215182]|uniref:DNA helicase n=1 Tax=Cognatiyoonia sp. IB215182 TaxID=3097353 RepID=UPI002A17BE32|nr:DNA helicase [Cognatiyoonia sp. IB215182]MDX8352784.1 DNA helicase [Cognatiyoonia sp. IB215182]